LIYEDARLKLKRGQIKPAEEETDRALRRFSSNGEEWHWRFRLLKAETLHRQGRNIEALAYASPEIPAPFDSSDIAIRRKLIQGAACAMTQRLTEADRFLIEAEARAQAGHPELLGEIALRRGTVWFLAGYSKEAGASYRSALTIARQGRDQFLQASALEGLGLVATKEEHYDEAIDFNRAALQMARSTGALHSAAQTLGNMAWCYRKLGDFENALELYNQAYEASKESHAAGDQIYWLTGIANVYYEQHNYAAAEKVLKQALEMARRQDDRGTLVEFLNDLSEIALETGRPDLATKYQMEALDIEKASPDKAGMVQSLLIRGHIDESRGDYDSAVGRFQQLISDPMAGSSQKWEARARLAGVYAKQSLNQKAEEEFLHALDTVETVRSSVQTEELRLSFLATARSFYSRYIEFLISRGRIEDALQIAQLSRTRTLAEGLKSGEKTPLPAPHNINPRRIAQHLKSTILFYWIGERHSYLWAITPAGLSCFPLPTESQIDPVAKAYRRAIVEGRDVLTSDSAIGRQLHAMLVAPANKLISKNSRVILIPSESLYGLNFETLIVPDPKPHFWIEDVTLSTASSLSLLSNENGKYINQEKNLFLVGNPESLDPDFPPLTQASAEISKVSAHFPAAKRRILVGQQASASAYLKEDLRPFTYLHFAAHGIANHLRPLDSAIILSREGDSCKLYARDIILHPLKAQLVSITACNSAGTRAFAGEGLVGLSWAFLRAGARNVIASLWEVSDASSTAQLMDALYDGLEHGKDAAEALRDAKLIVLKSNSQTVFRKPFYWAPFQLYQGY
jgi:CHAT domain-containing protein